MPVPTISFDESIPLVSIIKAAASIGCTLKVTDGDLRIVPLPASTFSAHPDTATIFTFDPPDRSNVVDFPGRQK